MRIKRLALAGASLVLIGAMTAACGGDGAGDGASGAPDDASVTEFCDAIKKTGENTDDVDATKKSYEDLVEVGTPEDIPEDARKGFEVLADAVEEADADDKEAPYAGDEEKEKQVSAYITYVSEVCAEAFAE
jgi:hypothetical protein